MSSAQLPLFAAPPVVTADIAPPAFDRAASRLHIRSVVVPPSRFARMFDPDTEAEPREEVRQEISIPNGDGEPARFSSDRARVGPDGDVAAELANEWLASADAKRPQNAAALLWLTEHAPALNYARWYWDLQDALARAADLDLRRRQALATADIIARGLRRNRRLGRDEQRAVWAEHNLED